MLSPSVTLSSIFNEDYSKLNFQFPVGNVVRHGEAEESLDIIVVKGAKSMPMALIYSMFMKNGKEFLASWTGDDVVRVGKLEYQEPATR